MDDPTFIHGGECLLDRGYIKLIETWGKGEAGVPEAGIIEAARQSTQGNFRGWAPYELCVKCEGWKLHTWEGHALDHNLDPGCVHEWKLYKRGDEGLLSFLFSNKPQHATPFEFAGLIIEVQAPIFVFREWHRHRTQSYNEMSARYAPLPPYDYMPTLERCLLGGAHAVSTTNKQAQGFNGVELTGDAAIAWLSGLQHVYDTAEAHYQRGLQIGIPKEIARCSMVVSRYSRMRASANLRNMLGFMTLRADAGAQWEIQRYAEALGRIIAREFPRTWKLYDLQTR